MVPVLWALRSAGHDVRVAAPPFFASTVLQAGLPVVACSSQVTEESSLRPTAMEKTPVSPSNGADVLGIHRRFTRIAHAMGDDVEELTRWWAPDVVISDSMDVAGRRVASAHGLPHVEHRWGLAIPDEPRRLSAEDVFGEESREWPGMGEKPSALVLDPCPPTLQRPDARPEFPVRYVPFNGPALLSRRPAASAPGRPRVVITLGTIVSADPDAGALLRSAVDAAERLGAEVVVASDRRTVPEDLTRRVPVARWLPIGLVAGECDLVIHHGGSGTMMSALACGRPQVLSPAFLDQCDNAERIEAVGAGRVVERSYATCAGFEQAMREVLTDPAFRLSAESLQAEIFQAPPPVVAAQAIAEIARNVHVSP
ncbi:glycosyltransferase [Microbispora hainanensis]|nr:nucleotide disphospho-sugar-binding domain-containing protein [Microbispora hainanensis]